MWVLLTIPWLAPTQSWHKKNPSAVGAPKPTLGGFWRGITRQCRANRVISQTVPHPYMMLMLGRGQWARQGSMRSDAGVSGVYAPLTKGDRDERIHAPRCSHSRLEYNHKTTFRKNSYVAASLTDLLNAVLLPPSSSLAFTVIRHRTHRSGAQMAAEHRWRRRSKSPAAIQHKVAAIQRDLHLPGTSTPRGSPRCKPTHVRVATLPPLAYLMHCASLRRWSDADRRE